MEQFATRLYRKPLRFEVEEVSTETGSITFVDKEVLLEWDQVTFIRKDPNKKFVIGVESQPTKIRYPEYIGAPLVRPRKLRAWMRATMYAELSTELSDHQRLGAIRNMAELQLAGYPNRLLRKMVAGITQRPVRRLRMWAQRYMQACKRAYGPGPMQKQDVHDEMLDLHLISETEWELRKDAQKLRDDSR